MPWRRVVAALLFAVSVTSCVIALDSTDSSAQQIRESSASVATASRVVSPIRFSLRTPARASASGGNVTDADAPGELTPPLTPQLPAVRNDVAAREDVAKFRDRVTAALATPGADRAYWGVLVTDADSGDVLYALNASRYFVPASNVKLFTTVLALATLGPDFRTRTTIEATGPIDHAGVLNGNLVLVGRGDANLSNRVFPFARTAERSGTSDRALAEMADRVASLGVKQISGDVIADDSYFALAKFPPGWTVDDTVWSYGAAVSAIAVNDNALTLEVKPGTAVGAPLRINVDPWSSLYSVRNDAVTTAFKTEPQLRLARDPESHVFQLSGSLPLGAQARQLVLAVTEPAENAAALLAHLLQERGLRIQGRARAIHASDVVGAVAAQTPTTVLAERFSPSVMDDVRLTNKLSQNLHAELLLRVAAREKGGAVTLEDALSFAEQFRQSIGILADDVQLSDGSGLSRNDLVTPQSIVQLLTYAARQPWGASFIAALPVAGEDGTLGTRMKAVGAGLIHAKTGSFNHVDSLSGYATSLRGQHVIFSIFGNNIGVRTRDAAAIIDLICAAMVEELGPAPAALKEAAPDRSAIPAPAPGIVP